MTSRHALQGIPGIQLVRLTVLLLMCAAILVAPSISHGQKTAATAPPSTAQVSTPANKPPELTPADVEVFFDGLIPAFLEHNDVAGGGGILVKGGRGVW